MPVPMSTVTSTLAMVRAAERRGLDPAPTLARHGVSLPTLLDADNHIPVAVEFAIWDELRDRTGQPALQLFAPIELPLGTYHVVEYLIGASATVGEGLQRLARFIGIIAKQVALTTAVDAREGHLAVAAANGSAVPPVYADYTLGAVVGRVRHFRPALQVLRVELRRERPADVSPYLEVFRTDVRFGAPADRICFERAEWDTPFATRDPSLAGVLETYARLRLERVGQSAVALTADVRAAIIRALPDGAQVELVARALHVSVRTLQRRLSDAGTSYREALDEVRSELARQYLSDRSVAIAEVALLLGFSDQSSFHRAFERWTGEAPGQWRAKASTR